MYIVSIYEHTPQIQDFVYKSENKKQKARRIENKEKNVRRKRKYT